MELKFEAEGVPMIVSVEEFKALIRAGKVKAEALYREVWTSGEWRRVDTLPVFRRMTAPDYSYEDELKKEREFWAKRERDRQIAVLLNPFITSRHAQYTTGELIERCYRIRPLREVALEPETLGVARLLMRPSFSPEVVFTFRFTPEVLKLESAAGSTSVYQALSDIIQRASRTGDQKELEEFLYTSKVTRAEGKLAYRDVPEPFRSWPTYIRTALELEPCEPCGLDGCSYLQTILHAGEIHAVEWWNPNETSSPKQKRLLMSYFECLTAAGLLE